MKKYVLKLMHGYHYTKFIRAYMTRMVFGTDASCRFSPTCSDYAEQAVKKYGVVKGTFMGIQRLLRCHPFTMGGYDPVK